MQLKDFKETSGVYMGVRPIGASIHMLHDWIIQQGIPNPIAAHAAHVTVLFSKTPVDVKIDRTNEYHAHGVRFQQVRHRFDKTNALVLVLESSALVARHNGLISQGASHDYVDYMPHVTLTTNIENFDWSILEVPKFGLVFANEYARPLRQPTDAAEL